MHGRHARKAKIDIGIDPICPCDRRLRAAEVFPPLARASLLAVLKKPILATAQGEK